MFKKIVTNDTPGNLVKEISFLRKFGFTVYSIKSTPKGTILEYITKDPENIRETFYEQRLLGKADD